MKTGAMWPRALASGCLADAFDGNRGSNRLMAKLPLMLPETDPGPPSCQRPTSVGYVPEPAAVEQEIDSGPGCHSDVGPTTS